MLVGSIVHSEKITKCFVSGLKLGVFREEMYSVHSTLDVVIREVREELTTYRDILEISDRIKKVEPGKDFSKNRKDIVTEVSNFKMSLP